MRNISELLKNRVIDYPKLNNFGFIDNIYQGTINNDLKIVLKVDNNMLYSSIVDINTNEEYVLANINSSIGNYAVSVKTKYEEIIESFINNCTYMMVFKSVQAQQVIEYVRSNFEGELEFLWDNDDCGIWRNKDNNKWYGLMMVINACKLDDSRNDNVDVINLKYDKDCSDEIVDNKNIFKAYHMNKRSWISIILDGTLDNNIIFKLIDNSYDLVK